VAKKGGSNYAGQIGWAVGILEFLNDPGKNPTERYWRVIEEGSGATKWPWQDQGIAGLWGDYPRPDWDAADTQFTPGRNNQAFAPYFRNREQNMLGPARVAIMRYLGDGKGRNMDQLKVSYVKTYRRQWIAGEDAKRFGGRGKATGPVEVKTKTWLTPSDFKRARRALLHWYLTGATRPNQIPFVYGVIKKPVEGANYYGKAMAKFKPTLPAMQAKAMREALGFAFSGDTKVLQQLRKIQAFDNSSGTARTGRAVAERRTADLKKYEPFDTAIRVQVANVVVQSLIRDSYGRFVNGTWQAALREANERIAMAYQAMVVAEMRNHRHRPATNALVEATANAENRFPRNTRGGQAP
jgi:hypothetical protein